MISITIAFGFGLTREYTLSDEQAENLENGQILHIDIRHPMFEERFIVKTKENPK